MHKSVHGYYVMTDKVMNYMTLMTYIKIRAIWRDGRKKRMLTSGMTRHMATQPGVARGFNASANAIATLMTDLCPGRVSAHTVLAHQCVCRQQPARSLCSSVG
jgi:hypothetical protein